MIPPNIMFTVLHISLIDCKKYFKMHFEGICSHDILYLSVILYIMNIIDFNS